MLSQVNIAIDMKLPVRLFRNRDVINLLIKNFVFINLMSLYLILK